MLKGASIGDQDLLLREALESEVFEAEGVHWRECNMRLSSILAWCRTIASSDFNNISDRDVQKHC